MSDFKYPIHQISEHGCRLVGDDESYADDLSESSVSLSPLVEIPKGYLLVGPTQSRLMILHALLMASDFEFLPKPRQGRPIDDQDVTDLAAGLMANFGYTALGGGMGPRTAAANSNEIAELNRIRTEKGPFQAAVAGLLFSHGDAFRDLAERGRIYLLRRIVQGYGIRDQVSTFPMVWESTLMTGPNPVMGWKVPSETLLRTIDRLREEPGMQPLLAHPVGVVSSSGDAARPRQRA